MGEINFEEYCRLSAKDIETAREAVRQAAALMNESNRDRSAIRLCLESHDYDDALGLLSLAMNANEGDVLDPLAASFACPHDKQTPVIHIMNSVMLGLTAQHPMARKFIGWCERLANLDPTTAQWDAYNEELMKKAP